MAGSKLVLLVDGRAVLLVVGSFSRLPATSEQKLASDDDDATHSSLLAVEAIVTLLFANDSTS